MRALRHAPWVALALCVALLVGTPRPGGEVPEAHTALRLTLSGGLTVDELLELRPGDVLAAVLERASAEEVEGVDLTLVRVLGRLGAVEGLDCVLDLAARRDPAALRSRRVRGTYLDAISALLLADPGSWEVLRDRTRTLDAPRVQLVVDAVALRGDPEGAWLLVTLLGSDDGVDQRILATVGELGAARPWVPLGISTRRLRSYLDHGDWRLRREAAVTLARLHDLDSFPDLLELLEDENAAVRGGAAWALGLLSGSSATRDAATWWEWFEGESDWRRNDSALVLARLHDSDPAVVLDAARELTRHPLYRHETAADLAAVVGDLPPEAATEVCLLLEALGDPRACPELARALMQVDGELQPVVGATLQRLSGVNLPADDALGWHRYTSR